MLWDRLGLRSGGGKELGRGGSSPEGKDYLKTIFMKLGGGIILFLFSLR